MRGGDRSGLGRWGEDQAARYLRAQGCAILAARFRCREGEIDLVAREGDFLCFVEVKLRRDARLAQAREFVTPAKQRKVRTAAMQYLIAYPSALQSRFDVVEVYAPYGEATKNPVIRHWKNAF